MKLTFITGNQHKVEALEHWLGRKLDHHRLDIEELQSLDPHLVVRHKAIAAYNVLHSPVLVEDTSLACKALGRLPGTFIKWFLEELGPDGICKLIPAGKDRSATAMIIYGLYDGKELHLFEGIVKGALAVKPRGQEGFGWDPIFIPEGSTKTYGEMNHLSEDTELSHFSVRNQAVQKLKAFLDKQDKKVMLVFSLD